MFGLVLQICLDHGLGFLEELFRELLHSASLRKSADGQISGSGSLTQKFGPRFVHRPSLNFN